MALSQEQVDGIYKKVMDAILRGLETQELEAYEASEIAEYLLSNVEKLQGDDAISNFYSQMADLWPFLDILMDEANALAQKQIEGEAIVGALDLLQQGKIDEALDIAKTATAN